MQTENRQAWRQILSGPELVEARERHVARLRRLFDGEDEADTAFVIRGALGHRLLKSRRPGRRGLESSPLPPQLRLDFRFMGWFYA